MNLAFATYEKRDHLAFVTINRPEVMNALHKPAHDELSAIWDDFDADPDAWVAILAGAGDRAFCAGNDLKYVAAHPEVIGADQSPRAGFGGITSRHDLFKPVIAAVNGYALGGGFEIALACDLIVASTTAQFGFPEPRVGDIANEGGLLRLSRQVPLKVAMSVVLAGRRLSADEAQRWGLVNEVVPPAELVATAERFAREIMEGAPLAIRASKEAVLTGMDQPLPVAMRLRNANFEALLRSADAIEGPRAFTERRKPSWTGA